MSTIDDTDDDMAAAEFVLGTLPTDERSAAHLRRQRDPAFDAAITAWEGRLQPLSEAGPEVSPPRHVWDGILARLGLLERPTGLAASNGDTHAVAILRRSVRRWRAAAVTATALAACLAGLALTDVLRPPATPGPSLVAFLQKTDAPPAYLLKANLGARSVSVKPVDAVAPAGRSYELWIIAPELGGPRSLGLLDAATETHSLPAGITSAVAAGATYAVTNEPLGGSPNGSPSAAPIFVGHLVSSVF